MDAEAFLDSLQSELLTAEEFADTTGISETLSRLDVALTHLAASKDQSDLIEFLSIPGAHDLAGYLLGTSPYLLKSRGREVASQLANWRDWLLGANLRDALVGVLLADAHRSRAQRRRRKFTDLVAKRLRAIAKRLQVSVATRRAVRLGPSEGSRTFDYVIEADGKPLVAVIDIFQTRAGGRQQDVFLGLPDLQRALLNLGINLLVVADGPGFHGMAPIVRRVAPQLSYFVNLRGLRRSSEPKKAIESAMSGLPDTVRSGDRQDVLNRTAELALRAGRAVDATTLGLSTDEFSTFLLRFAAVRNELAVETSDDRELNAQAQEQILRASGVTVDSSPREIEAVIEDVVSWLGGNVAAIQKTSEGALYAISLPGMRLRLPDPFPLYVATTSETAGVLDRADLAITDNNVSARVRLVLFLVSRVERDELAPVSRAGGYFGLLDLTDLANLLLRRAGQAAREYFAELLLRDVNLAVVSPFVSEGPTPSEMFFGRERELRRIAEQVQRQSFALVGGRKVGKTSILQRLRNVLPPRFPVLYVDCQAHPDREDFLRHLLAAEGVTSQSRASEAERVIRQVAANQFGDRQGVILLDEVDELFRADSEADQFPHVLSRALRALSQQRRVMVVATGERALFQLTRDPSSPHWNFCTPIQIGPLEAQAAQSLLRDPLEALDLSIGDDALHGVVEATSCHPNLIQFVGGRIVDELARVVRPGESTQVGLALVDEIVGSYEFRNRFLTTYWSQATAVEKLISIHLQFDSDTDPDALFQALSDTLPVTSSMIRDALMMLQLYSVAIPTDRGFRLRARSFESQYDPLRSSPLETEWREEVRLSGR